MTSRPNQWDKTELQLYILLLCANADAEETPKELELIKSKANSDIFKKIYKEFNGDSEEQRLDKIERAIHDHQFTVMELSEFRTEIHKIFMSDGRLSINEGRLDSILDNILY
jgi:hypothetical protein